MNESVPKEDTHLVSKRIPDFPYRIQVTDPNAVKIVDRNSITREIQVSINRESKYSKTSQIRAVPSEQCPDLRIVRISEFCPV